MPPDFSDTTLIKLAGKQAFERGREYFTAGCLVDSQLYGVGKHGFLQALSRVEAACT